MDKYTLRQYQALEKEIRCLKDEIERLRESFSAPLVHDGMPRASTYQDRVATLTARIIDLDNILTSKLSQLIDCRILIEEAIDTLDSADRLLLRLRYIDGKRWDEIADEMGYSTRRILQIHGNAIKRLH